MKRIILGIMFLMLISFVVAAPGDPTCFLNASNNKTACVGGNAGIGNFTGNVYAKNLNGINITAIRFFGDGSGITNITSNTSFVGYSNYSQYTNISNLQSLNYSTDISNEATYRIGNDTLINSSITNLQTNITNLVSNDSELSTRITNVNTNVTTLQGTVSSLVTNTSSLQSNVGSLVSNLSIETGDRQSNDTLLSNRINAVNTTASAATNYSQYTNISNLNINTTTLSKTNGLLDIVLSFFTNLFYQKSEVYNKTEIDTQQQNQNTNISDLQSANVSTNSRIDSVNSTVASHTTQINSLASNLTTETSDRQSNDTALGNRITNVNSNVTNLQNGLNNLSSNVSAQNIIYTNQINNLSTNLTAQTLRIDSLNASKLQNGSDALLPKLYTDVIYLNKTSGTPLSAPNGSIYYTDGADSQFNMVIDAGAGVILQAGEELYLDKPAKNADVATINNCAPVYVSGSQGNHLLVKLADANSYRKAQAFVGLATQQILVNGFGRITARGSVGDCDTSAWNEGTILYLGPTSGVLTNVTPSGNQTKVFVGVVTVSNVNNGKISVFPQFIPSMDDLSFVNFTNINNAVLVYNNVTGLWGSVNSQVFNDTTLINAVNTTDNILSLYANAQRDPQGYNDTTSAVADTHSTLAFNDATRNFTITPNGTAYYYFKGLLKSFTTVKSIQISNTTGNHILYIDSSGNLVDGGATLTDTILCDNVITAIVYWEATRGLSYYFIDERHTHYMECQVHYYLHEHLGTQYDSGIAPQNLTIGGSTSSNLSAQISTSAGSISDEDYTHNIIQYTFPGRYRVYYQIGATGNWSYKVDNFPFIYSGDASGYSGTRAAYNLNTGGVWSLTTVTANNNYVLFHVFATNFVNNSGDVVIVQGQAQYTTLALARTGADTELSSIRASNIFGPEFKPLYTFTVQTSSTYSNTPKGIIVAPSTGGSYIDWRTSNLNGASGTTTGGTVTLIQGDSTISINGVAGGSSTSTATIGVDNTYIQGFNDTVAISNEQTYRIGNDTLINLSITNLQTNVTNLVSNDSGLSTRITNVNTNVTGLQSNVGSLSTNLTNEISARQSIGNWSNDKQYYANKSASESITGNWIFTPSTNTTFSNSGQTLFYNPVYFYNTVTMTNTTTMTVNGSVQLKNIGGTVIGNWADNQAGVANFWTNGYVNASEFYDDNVNINTLYYPYLSNPYSYYNSSTIPSYVLNSNLVSAVGNWSADKSSYATLSSVQGANTTANSALPSATAVSLYVNRSNWTTIDNYPAACGAGQFVTTIGDTLTCASAGTGSVTGTGVANTLPKWTNSTNLGNSSLTDDGTTITVGTGTSQFEVNSTGTYVLTNITITDRVIGTKWKWYLNATYWDCYNGSGTLQNRGNSSLTC